MVLEIFVNYHHFVLWNLRISVFDQNRTIIIMGLKKRILFIRRSLEIVFINIILNISMIMVKIFVLILSQSFNNPQSSQNRSDSIGGLDQKIFFFQFLLKILPQKLPFLQRILKSFWSEAQIRHLFMSHLMNSLSMSSYFSNKQNFFFSEH